MFQSSMDCHLSVYENFQNPWFSPIFWQCHLSAWVKSILRQHSNCRKVKCANRACVLSGKTMVIWMKKGPFIPQDFLKEGQHWPLDSRQHCTCCRTGVPLLWVEGQFGLMHFSSYLNLEDYIYFTDLYLARFSKWHCMVGTADVLTGSSELFWGLPWFLWHTQHLRQNPPGYQVSDDQLCLLEWKRLWVPSWKLQLGLLVSFLLRT